MGATNEPSPGVLENAAKFMAMCYLKHRNIAASGGTLELRTLEEIARGECGVTLCPLAAKDAPGENSFQ